jgi:hypothetical protein
MQKYTLYICIGCIYIYIYIRYVIVNTLQKVNNNNNNNNNNILATRFSERDEENAACGLRVTCNRQSWLRKWNGVLCPWQHALTYETIHFLLKCTAIIYSSNSDIRLNRPVDCITNEIQFSDIWDENANAVCALWKRFPVSSQLVGYSVTLPNRLVHWWRFCTTHSLVAIACYLRYLQLFPANAFYVITVTDLHIRQWNSVTGPDVKVTLIVP